MRTRFLSRCTNDEVEAYLSRNDIVFVACGVTELHGGRPLDCESVLSEALALKLAEKADGLVVHNLPYLYAGATASGRGTTQLSVRASIDYLYGIAESLIRQGFRRIVWTSMHGPASTFIGPVVRDIFDTHKVAMLYIDPIQVLTRAPGGMAALLPKDGSDPFGDMAAAAYDTLGRLTDLPLGTPESSTWGESRPSSIGFAQGLIDAAFGSSSTAYYFGELTDHMRTQILATEAERREAADRGQVLYEGLVDLIHIEKLVADLADLAAYNEAAMARYPSTRRL
jgi:creatinine amidohydrolase